MREKTVPADCTVLVVGGPEKDLLPETTGAIRDFVKKGGKALVMVEAELKEPYPNLVALLKEWNIEAGKRRGGGRLGDGPALRLLGARPARHRVPLAPDHQGLPPAHALRRRAQRRRRARARSRASPPRTS